MADTAFTIWSAKRFYGSLPMEVTWRPVTSIPLADTDGNPDTVADPDWLPLVTTPSHPEYPAGHPGQNGAAATVLLSYFRPEQVFTLTTAGQPSRTYTSIQQARSDGNNGPRLGWHALPEHNRDQRRRRPGDRKVCRSKLDATSPSGRFPREEMRPEARDRELSDRRNLRQARECGRTAPYLTRASRGIVASAASLLPIKHLDVIELPSLRVFSLKGGGHGLSVAGHIGTTG